MDGLLRCSRYSFGPNRLHYCGPDKNQEIFSYMENNVADPGLASILQKFSTLHKYLELIARANRVENAFDEKVVEAYWIGNDLLQNVDKKKIYDNLVDLHEIKKKISPKDFEHVSEKIGKGALPHHSFHVLNIWKRTGNMDVPHTLESMNECRISWGKITSLHGPKITVETKPLIMEKSQLKLGSPIFRTIIRRLESDTDIEQMKIGDTITFHWGVPCEVITSAQAAALKKYTLLSIAFANQTI